MSATTSEERGRIRRERGDPTDVLSSRLDPALDTAWSGFSGPSFHGFADDVVRIDDGDFCRVFDEVTAEHA